MMNLTHSIYQVIMKKTGIPFLWILVICQFAGLTALGQSACNTEEELISEFRRLVTPETLYNYVDILSADEYEGRLTGHQGYDKSARWVSGKFSSWGVKPMGADEDYLQYFPHPYTEVFPGCHLILHPGQTKEEQKKKYEYVEDFIPGSSASNFSSMRSRHGSIFSCWDLK